MRAMTTSQNLRRRTVALTAMLALATLGAACVNQPPPPGPTAPPDPTAAPRAAAGTWLVSQFDTGTGLIPSAYVPGANDLLGSAQAAATLGLTGTGTATASAAVAALATQVDAAVKDGSGNDKPGALARVILAVHSTGGDPRAFGGTDLVARLEATIQTSGPDAGRFGVQDATYDGAFRQGLSLAALSVVSPTPASIDGSLGTINAEPAVAWLRTQQCADGSWMPSRPSLSTPCAFDPITYAGPDTNSTAMAQLGLRAVGSWAPVNPLGWLSTIRNADGGWSYDGSAGSPSDPDSTGLVMAAIRSLGLTPDPAATASLLSFQLGSADPVPDRGAFFYSQSSRTPSLLATNDAVLGLSPGVWPGS